jgi:hypothetical protein
MPNSTVGANGEAMPKINRRRFLLNTTMAGAAVAVAAPAAAAEPEMTTHEKAVWHIRELERLVRECGMEKVTVMVIGVPFGSASFRDFKVISLNYEGTIRADDGLFVVEGGEA